MMGDHDIYIFTKWGIVQYVMVTTEEGKQQPALLAARGAANAKQVMREAPGIRAELVGPVEGETLKRHIELALADGCQGSLMRDDDGDHWYSWKNRPRPEPTRLTNVQIESIGSDPLLTDQIFGADMIAAVNVNTGEEATLWRRPASGATLRGFPVFGGKLTFGFSSNPELRKLKAAINRVNRRRKPPTA